MACGSCGGSISLRKPNTRNTPNNNAIKNNQQEITVFPSSSKTISFQRSENITKKRTKV